MWRMAIIDQKEKEKIGCWGSFQHNLLSFLILLMAINPPLIEEHLEEMNPLIGNHIIKKNMPINIGFISQMIFLFHN